MAGGISPKCKHCTKEVDKSLEHVKKSNGYYHTDCYEKLEEEKRLKKEAQLVKKKEKEEAERLQKEERKRLRSTTQCSRCGKDVVKTDEDTKMIGTNYYHSECAKAEKEERKSERMKTCAFCENELKPEDEIDKDYKGYYHLECLQKKRRIAKNKEDLCLYIAKLYEMKFPTSYMLKQMDDFYKKRGYSYKSMYATLVYMYEVEKLIVKEGTGLGLIPFYYEKAKRHYAYLQNAKQSVTKDGKMIIHNSAEKIKAVRPIKRKIGIIDMSNL